MFFQVTELPRVDGVITGAFACVHESSEFALEGYGFRFTCGRTEALESRIIDRLACAFGPAVSFAPLDRESGDAIVSWLMERGCTEGLVDGAQRSVDALFPEEQTAAPDRQTSEETPRAKGRRA